MNATNPDLTPSKAMNPFDDAPTSKHEKLSDELGDLLADVDEDEELDADVHERITMPSSRRVG